MPYTFQQLTITDIDGTTPPADAEGADDVPGPGPVPRCSLGEGPVLRRSVQLAPALRRRLRTTAAALGVPASVVARHAIDALLHRGDAIAPSPAHDTATRTARLTIAAPVWWWSRFRAAAVEADVAQHEVVHAALTAAFARR